jgi:hypothetical protein
VIDIEKPVLFSAPMVRAILAGKKTQTRRLPRRDEAIPTNGTPYFSGLLCEWRWMDESGANGGLLRCPYGVPGDRLWVRETFRFGDGHTYATPPHYRADSDDLGGGPWRSARYMPRYASRITLEVTDVRVQRLQEVSSNDIAAEMGWLPCKRGDACPCAVDMFRPFWNRINGKRAPWASNPWVWAITFKRLKP